MKLEGGADDWTNLEPSALVATLEELEDWGTVLKADPEVSRKLKEFEAAARCEARSPAKSKTPKQTTLRGPSI